MEQYLASRYSFVFGGPQFVTPSNVLCFNGHSQHGQVPPSHKARCNTDALDTYIAVPAQGCPNVCHASEYGLYYKNCSSLSSSSKGEVGGGLNVCCTTTAKPAELSVTHPVSPSIYANTHMAMV